MTEIKNPPTFEGLPGEDVHKWITTMRAELERRSLPRTEWVSTATIFLGTRVRRILEEAKATSEWDGEWESFTSWLRSTFNGASRLGYDSKSQIEDDPPPYTPNTGGPGGGGGGPGGGPGGGGGGPGGGPGGHRSAFRRFREDYPTAATAAAVGLAITAPIAGPIVLVGALNAVGFGAGGVVAGSIAAGIQSAFYGGAVASGSLFAIAQSIGAGGAALAAVGPAVSAGAGALGLLGAAQVAPRRAA
ncbi:hypothetical protein B0H16DRAFT_1811710 [Mycena metata]|uniref:Uncharacterized protein n=1 Tax=Mycena metata TaxID=1033252 RepID=A0AAD7H670_9AGAR|nr:hypothetical protein B0H16DRAFT_1811710 [Mycena metata]